MESTQPTWNDARMDEFSRRTEENFREVRKEIRGVEAGMRAEINERFTKLEGTFSQRFDILFGALATGIFGVVVSHFIG